MSSRATRSESRSEIPREIPRVLHHLWWLPLTWVALIIIALTATPVIVSMRVRRMRQELSDGTDPARVLLNDLEIAVATQALALDGHNGADSAVATRAAKRERGDELALDPLMARIGPDAVEHFAQLRTLVSEWQRRARRSPGAAETPTEVIAAAEDFSGMLQQRAVAQRDRIRALEHANVVSAVILAPLALIATATLVLTGRRILLLAREATAGRTALATAADERAALLRGVTHDLKNPLGAAYGYGELLADGVLGPLSTEQHDVVVRMQGLVTGALRTVSDLLDLYRDETGSLTIEHTRADLNALADECVADFLPSAQQHGVTLRLERSASAAVVTTDPARVKQILGNLVSNAVKYTPPGGEAVVAVASVRDDGDPTYRIAVRDTGPGIPAALRDRIFDEFYRLPTAASIPGSGVGLAISRRLARLLGGDLTVGDAPGGGAEFTLSLPAAS